MTPVLNFQVLNLLGDLLHLGWWPPTRRLVLPKIVPHWIQEQHMCHETVSESREASAISSLKLEAVMKNAAYSVHVYTLEACNGQITSTDSAKAKEQPRDNVVTERTTIVTDTRQPQTEDEQRHLLLGVLRAHNAAYLVAIMMFLGLLCLLLDARGTISTFVFHVVDLKALWLCALAGGMCVVLVVNLDPIPNALGISFQTTAPSLRDFGFKLALCLGVTLVGILAVSFASSTVGAALTM